MMTFKVIINLITGEWRAVQEPSSLFLSFLACVFFQSLITKVSKRHSILKKKNERSVHTRSKDQSQPEYSWADYTLVR